jgi:uncharacterized membrane protein
MRFATAERTEAAAAVRAALAWGVLIAAELFVRQLFDTFAPPAPRGYGPRSAVTTYAAVGTFLLIGIVEAHRAGRLRSGPIVAVCAGLVGHVLGIIATAVLYFTVIARDAAKLTTFDMTGGWDETLGFSVIVPLVGALFALIGALISRAFSRLSSLVSP